MSMLGPALSDKRSLLLKQKLQQYILNNRRNKTVKHYVKIRFL